MPDSPKVGKTARSPTTNEDSSSNPYNVDLLSFPPDIAWLRSNENYVIFYINVPADSAAADGNPGSYVTDSSGAAADLSPITDTTVGGTGTILEFGKPYKRLKTAICLPIMERPVAKYSADWDMATLGPVLGWAMTHGHDSNDANEEVTKGIKMSLGSLGIDAVKTLGLSFVNNVANGLGGFGGDVNAKDIFSILSRTAVNEHRTQIFKSMKFRSFDFEYHFSPKDASESAIIQNIIRQFKYHMHPDKVSGNIFLTYPSEFDIVFYFKTGENAGPDPNSQFLFKVSTCALNDFTVEYGGEKFFTHGDGSPIEVVMRLSFTELELLTKPRIAQGY